jgi:hypothetical protein
MGLVVQPVVCSVPSDTLQESRLGEPLGRASAITKPLTTNGFGLESFTEVCN